VAHAAVAGGREEELEPHEKQRERGRGEAGRDSHRLE
jgi:hypothetical protein